jgi:AcrR family transcriptional regulator
MVVTPWGTSESLRETMLPPGPGSSAAAVAGNQRRRLFGAMVASVAERGYWNTRVADLVGLSGVSLRSFYDLYPDKRSCFVATVSALASAAVAGILNDLGDSPWEAESQSRLAAFAELAAAQPAAARLFLIEAYVAGPEAVAVVDETSRQIEELVRRRLATSEKWSKLPPEIGTMAVAAILESFRSRIVRGQTQRLPELAEEIATLLLSLEPPARPLRAASRPPEVRPEEHEASDHAERALRAFEALLTEQLYTETTMEQVAKRARMSVRTLYANFSSREDLMLAAIDSAGALTMATALPAYRRGPNPAEGIRAALAAVLGLWASRPNLAHLLLVAIFEGGAPALERRSEALQPLEGLISKTGHWRIAAAQRSTPEAIIGGILGLARRRLIDGGAGGLPSLAPICTYVALFPTLGAEQATGAAEGKSYRRSEPRLLELSRAELLDAQSAELLTYLSHGGVRAEELARATGRPREEIEDQLSLLTEKGLAQVVEDEEERAETLFSTGWRVWNNEEWEERDPMERAQISAEIGGAIKEEVEEAFAAGTFDSRPERTLIRLPMWLDDEGWRELQQTLDGTFETCQEIQRRVQQRRERRDAEPGIPARVILASFEAPLADSG